MAIESLISYAVVILVIARAVERPKLSAGSRRSVRVTLVEPL